MLSNTKKRKENINNLKKNNIEQAKRRYYVKKNMFLLRLKFKWQYNILTAFFHNKESCSTNSY
jgi:hypothetical protein